MKKDMTKTQVSGGNVSQLKRSDDEKTLLLFKGLCFVTAFVWVGYSWVMFMRGAAPLGLALFATVWVMVALTPLVMPNTILRLAAAIKSALQRLR